MKIWWWMMMVNTFLHINFINQLLDLPWPSMESPTFLAPRRLAPWRAAKLPRLHSFGSRNGGRPSSISNISTPQDHLSWRPKNRVTVVDGHEISWDFAGTIEKHLTTGWWFWATYPSEKWWSESQLGWWYIPNIWKNNPNVPVTTNQMKKVALNIGMGWWTTLNSSTIQRGLNMLIIVDPCLFDSEILADPWYISCSAPDQSNSQA